MIRLRGQWVALDTEQLRRGLEFLERKPTGRKTTAEILALAASPPRRRGHPARGHRRTRRRLARGPAAPGPPPRRRCSRWTRPTDSPRRCVPTSSAVWRGWRFCPRSVWAAAWPTTWAWARRCSYWPWKPWNPFSATRIAASDPHCYCARCRWWATGRQQEAARFAPNLRVYAHHGGARLHGEALRDHLERTDLVVSTYTTAPRHRRAGGIRMEPGGAGRGPGGEEQPVPGGQGGATATRGAPGRADGTPMENRLAELWSIMDFLNPGLLGSSERFRTRYAIPIERHGHTEPADGCAHRRGPTSCAGSKYCQLTTEQASLYQAVVADMMEKIENTEGIERRGNVLAAMAKLKQVCNHPPAAAARSLPGRSAVREGDPARGDPGRDPGRGRPGAVCFTQFTEFAELLVPHLAARFGRAARDIAYLHGGTPRKRRDVTRWWPGSSPVTARPFFCCR